MAPVAAIVVLAGAPAILGTIPAYPGASRPLPTLETKTRAIALTSDKPEVVAAYYINRLTALGWTPAPEVPHELVAAKTGAPAWLTFTRTGQRVDLQITVGLHPKTHKPVTMVTITVKPLENTP
jgi:hypothetical protein